MTEITRPLAQTHPLALQNLLTYSRIAAVPVVVGCMYWSGILDGGLWLRWVALAVFIAAGITDILDGYLARSWDQQSALGRMLDPIADKLLVSASLLMLAAVDTIRGWSLLAAVVILCREKSWYRAYASISPSCGSACRSRGSPSGRPPRSSSPSASCWPARPATMHSPGNHPTSASLCCGCRRS